MNRLNLALFIMGMLLVTANWGAEEKGSKSEPKKNPIVVMETNFGAMEIELLFDAAPITAKNFLELVKKKFYDGLTFHRVVAGFVIQGGDPQGDGMGGPGYSIKDEKSALPEVRGTLGMAKSGPNTAGSQFYIALDRLATLDGNYTVFGQVVEGLDVIDKIVVGDKMNRVYMEPTKPN